MLVDEHWQSTGIGISTPRYLRKCCFPGGSNIIEIWQVATGSAREKIRPVMWDPVYSLVDEYTGTATKNYYLNPMKANIFCRGTLCR